MKMPRKPPDMEKLAPAQAEQFMAIVSHVTSATYKDRYIHWDELRHLSPPEGLSSEDWWFGLKLKRIALFKELPLTDEHDRPFKCGLPDPGPELLHRIDLGAGGLIGMQEQVTDPQTKDRYIVSSLIEEAIRSSQLEGAATTRVIAKEMIRSRRSPRGRSEQMILNNFRAMQQLQQFKNEALSPDLVLEIHRLITEDALDDASGAGRLRRPDEAVRIENVDGDVYHYPPPAEQLEDRLAAMCDFANGNTPARFIHPVVRAIILHFWLAYDHPFVDGNGRCARTLFYWSMLRQDYWLCEFMSISQIILRAPVKYSRAFLYTETDENDLTYFLLYHLDVICRAIDELDKYLRRKTAELQATKRKLKSAIYLNVRQQALISHALRHSDAQYSINSHRLSHGVVYQTARTDLMDLVKKGLLDADKISRTWYYRPAADLEKRLHELG